MDVMWATTLALIFHQIEADYLGNAAYLSACTPPMYIRRGASAILPESLAATSGTYQIRKLFIGKKSLRIVDVIPIRDMTAPEPTEREIAATSSIQQVYRNIFRYRRGAAKRGKAGLHAEIYALCATEVSRLVLTPGDIFISF